MKWYYYAFPLLILLGAAGLMWGVRESSFVVMFLGFIALAIDGYLFGCIVESARWASRIRHAESLQKLKKSLEDSGSKSRITQRLRLYEEREELR